MKRWMMAVTAVLMVGCGDGAVDKGDGEWLAQGLAHAEERRLDLGAATILAATGTADTVYLSSREPGYTYQGPLERYFDTITGDDLERADAERTFGHLNTAAGDVIEGCTTGSSPGYAMLDGGWSFETIASLNSGCGSDGSDGDGLACWGGEIRQCWVGGFDGTSVLAVEPYGVDDAPETALYNWRGQDFRRFDDLEAEKWALGVASDGDPIYVQRSMLANAPRDAKRYHILKGDVRLLDIEDMRYGSMHVSSHELDAIVWNDLEAETVKVSLIGSEISEPIFTLPGGEITSAMVDTYGKTVAAAVVLTDRIVVSSGGVEVELSRNPDERLGALVVTQDAVHVFIEEQFEDGAAQLRREVLELR